ncbi:MAG TPA: hypothetical protein VI703_05880 [Anaerolineales bacterium]|jgi:hypothetical protein|nr:hypothetical protein [Anaerolineales bacterium]
MNKQFTFWGVALIGVAFVVGGLAVLFLGLQAYGTVSQSLAEEKLEVADPAILLTYEGARAPEGVEVPTILVDTEAEAEAQARVIRTHTMGITGGKTYSEMDREDPARATYITSLTLQGSLYLAKIGLQLSQFVIGVGIAFTGLGGGILVLGLPLVRKVLDLK